MKRLFKILAIVLLPLSLTACGTKPVDPNSYVSKITLNTEVVNLDPEGSFTLTPKAFNMNGDELNEKTFTYYSSNPRVADVNPAGVITAYKGGQATISVLSDTMNTTCLVKVSGSGDEELISLSFSPSSVNIKVGGSYTPNLVPFPSTVSGIEYHYQSEDPTIADFENGKVIAKKLGETNIRATYGEIYADLHVKVSENGGDAFTITLNRSELSLLVDNEFQLVATCSEEATVTWTSENDSIANVSTTGLVTANGKGETHITATANGVSTSCTVLVSDGEPGGELAVTFYIDYNNTDENNPYSTLTWNCNKPFGLNNKPADPKTAPDPAFPVFKGWSSHTIIDDLKDLWDFEKDVVPDGMYNFTLYGIWMDN